jgi:plasmid maintenance system killer protein
MFIDQLSPHEKRVVMRRLSALYAARTPADANLPGYGLTLHQETDGEKLYSMNAGNDLRILFTFRNNTVVVLDVVRHSQIERLAHDQRGH